MSHTFFKSDGLHISSKHLCTGWCFLVAGILGIIITVMFVSRGDRLASAFLRTLDIDQKEVYRGIVKQRSRLFMTGIAVGILLTAVLVVVLKSLIQIETNRVGCFSIASTLLLACIYYQTSHKQDYMLAHIKTQEQANAWLDMYAKFKKVRYIGFLLGIMTYLLCAAYVF